MCVPKNLYASKRSTQTCKTCMHSVCCTKMNYVTFSPRASAYRKWAARAETVYPLPATCC
jgi:hypothetical protein